MNEQSYKILDAILFGFKQFKRNFLLLLGVTLLSIANVSLYLFIIRLITTQYTIVLEQSFLYGIVHGVWIHGGNFGHLLIILAYLFYTAIELIITMGWTRIALDIYDHGTSKVKRIFTTIPVVLNYVIAMILYTCISSFGLILLIIPGIYWFITFFFAPVFVIDTGCGPIESLRKSAAITYGHKWHLLLTILIFIGISMLSVITIIGPFVLTYVWLLSQIFIYRRLQEAKIREVPIPIDMP